jgi:hypothetical protein
MAAEYPISKILDPAVEKQVDSLTAAIVRMSEAANAVQMPGGLKEYNTAVKQYTASAKEADAEVKKLIATGERRAAVEKELNDAMKLEVKSINDAVRQNKALKDARDAVNTSTEQGKRTVSDYNAKIDQNTKFIKENSDADKQRTSGIGLYKQAVVGAMVAITAVIAAGSGIISFFKDAVKFAMDEEKSNQRLLFALNGNQEAYDRMLIVKKELVKTTTFSKDEINEAINYALSLGRSESQTQKMITAAMGLAKVTGKDLNTAMAMVAGTYEGSLRGLGRYAGGMKDLTEAQLKAGAGVDLLNEKFGRFATTGLETTASKMVMLDKAWHETKENIGVLLLPVVSALASAFKGVVGAVEEIVGINPAQEAYKEMQAQSDLIMRIQETVKGTKQRNDLLDELKAKYPSLLGNLKDEKISNQTLAGVLASVNQQYIDKVRNMGYQKQFEGFAKQQEQAETRAYDARTKANEAMVNMTNILWREFPTLAKLVSEATTFDEKMKLINDNMAKGYGTTGDWIRGMANDVKVLEGEATTAKGVFTAFEVQQAKRAFTETKDIMQVSSLLLNTYKQSLLIKEKNKTLTEDEIRDLAVLRAELEERAKEGIVKPTPKGLTKSEIEEAKKAADERLRTEKELNADLLKSGMMTNAEACEFEIEEYKKTAKYKLATAEQQEGLLQSIRTNWGEKELQDLQKQEDRKTKMIKDAQDKIDKIQSGEIKEVVTTGATEFSEFKTTASADRSKELNALVSMLELKQITVEDYKKKELAINQKYDDMILAESIKVLEQQIEGFKLIEGANDATIQAIKEAEIKLAELKVTLSNKTTDQIVANAETEAKKDTWNQLSPKEKQKKIEKETQDFYNSLQKIGNEYFQSQLNNLQTESDTDSVEKEKQLEAAKGNQKEIDRINKEFDAKEKERAHEAKRIAHDQAVYNQLTGVVNVAINTAVGAMRAYSDLGPIAGTIFAALIVAAGIVEEALILKQKIPSYKTGRKGGPKELAIVHKGEIIESGPSSQYVADDTLTRLPLGASVLTAEEVRQDYLNKSMARIPFYESKDSKLDTGAIVQGLDSLKKELKEIKNKKEVYINIDKHGFRTSLKSGQMWEDWINNRVRL